MGAVVSSNRGDVVEENSTEMGGGQIVRASGISIQGRDGKWWNSVPMAGLDGKRFQYRVSARAPGRLSR